MRRDESTKVTPRRVAAPERSQKQHMSEAMLRRFWGTREPEIYITEHWIFTRRSSGITSNYRRFS